MLQLEKIGYSVYCIGPEITSLLGCHSLFQLNNEWMDVWKMLLLW